MTDFNYNNYDIVALARDQKVVFYQEFGSYQGEWLCVSKDEKNYYIYKGYYGSCSGCDSLQGEEINTKEDAIKFIGHEGYNPFLIIPTTTMKNSVKSDEFQTIFPKNIREDFGEGELDQAIETIKILIKSYEGLVKASELLELKNLEYRREAIERYGEEKFMNELGGEKEDEDGENYLIRLKREPEDFVFVNVKDSSTPRRYLLRVPPDTKTVKEGIAWTFNLTTEDYKLEKET